MKKKANAYTQLITYIFNKYYTKDCERVEFNRLDIVEAAKELNFDPKNIGDVVYSFKFRSDFPQEILDKAPKGKEWVIKNIGRAKYAFVATKCARILPDAMLANIQIPDATPGMVAKYALSDEQALLAKLRYNRIIDIFTGITCYSLQNHLRTTVENIGQIETDELYVGVDKNGLHYIIPIQAKGGKDELSIVQIEQDIKLCCQKYPLLICKAIATQFMADDVIAIIELALVDDEIKKITEKHYKLVPPENISNEELIQFTQSISNL